jgi:hypothetical protein
MMSCCGNKRAAFAQEHASGVARQTGSSEQRVATSPYGLHETFPPVSTKMWTDLHFVNTGELAITAIGAVTGQHYRWTGKGDIQIVDYRDAGALRHQMKILKRVK